MTMARINFQAGNFHISQATQDFARDLGQFNRKPGYSLRRLKRSSCMVPTPLPEASQALTKLSTGPGSSNIQSLCIVGPGFCDSGSNHILLRQMFGGVRVEGFTGHDLEFECPVPPRQALILLFNVIAHFESFTAPLHVVDLAARLSLGGRLAVWDFSLHGETLGLNDNLLNQLGLGVASERADSPTAGERWLHVLTRERIEADLDIITNEIRTSLYKYRDVVGEY